MGRLVRRPIPEPQLTDESGQPIVFSTPGAPTLEERRKYAQAILRSRTPSPLSPERQAEIAAIQGRRREMLQNLGIYVNG